MICMCIEEIMVKPNYNNFSVIQAKGLFQHTLLGYKTY